jgi:signal transduction histidine kinase
LRKAGARLTFVGLAVVLALALIVPIVVFAGTTLGTLDTGLAARTSAERGRVAVQATRLVDQEIDAIETDLRILAARPEIQQGGRLRDAATMEAALAELLVRGKYSFVGVYDGTGPAGSALAAVAERSGEPVRGAAARVPVGAFAGPAGRDRALESFDRQVVIPALAQQSGFAVSGAFPSADSRSASSSAGSEREGPSLVFVGRPVLAPRPPPGAQLDIVAAVIAAPRFDDLGDRLSALAAPGRTVSLVARNVGTDETLVVLASTAPRGSIAVVDLPGRERVLAGASGETSYGGTAERVVAYAPIHSRALGQGPNWLITVTDDLVVTLGPERRLAGQIQGASLGAVVLAGAIAVALAFLVSLVERQRRTLSGLLRELEIKRVEVEAASAAKSRFLASMSHELRTPLNSIIGFSEVMQMEVAGPLTNKQRDYLGDVVGSGKHLLTLINDVLDLSKVEAGKIELRPEDLDLARVVEQVGAVMRPLAERKRLELSVTAPEDLGRIHHDGGRLRQILLNLASNAVKFTPEGGHVSIAAQRLDHDVEIVVRDSGIGLSEADLSTIFEEFRQIDSPYARSQEGTGLGLALVKRFVELMGGTIAVSSTAGVGSMFVVRLPVRQKTAVLAGS